MQLEQFIQQIIHDQSALFSHPVIALYGNEYPLLFTSQFLKLLSSKNPGLVVPLHVQDQEQAVVSAQLQTTFLGRSSIYWLADSLVHVARTKQQEWLNELRQYEGPNTVLFFMSGELPKSIPSSWSVVPLPDHASRELVTSVTKLYQTNNMVKIDQQFVRHLQSIAHQLSLDQLCLLLQYSTITAGGAAEFFKEWVPQLITPEQSLFTLSQHFFARKATNFLSQWTIVRDHYAPPFWISFWADQLWRAALFIECVKAGDKVEAKKISYKLPFSFIQRDYVKHSAIELKNAHQLLYDLDYRIKNSGDFVFLEKLYFQFFNVTR